MTTKELKRYNVERAPETLDLHFPDACDAAALTAELQGFATFRGRVMGVSESAAGTVVHCVHDLRADEMERIADVVDRHDGQMAKAQQALWEQLNPYKAVPIEGVTDPHVKSVLEYLISELESLKGQR